MAQLYFKYGAMGSSKSANALMARFNYEERGQETLLVKPQLDTRDGDHMVSSRIGLKHPCVYFHEMQAMADQELQKYACIIVDEAPVREARMTDGVLHTVLVKNVSKARFATLFGGYSAGDYKKLPQDIIRVSTAKVVRIEALEGDLTTCLDGESMHSQCVTLKLADKKVNFFAPKGCDPDATAR